MDILLYLVILILAVLGTPIFVVMTLFALSAFTFADEPISGIAVEIYRLANAPTLLTVPLFTFAGYMMAESKSPQRLLNLANAMLGKFPGGIAIVSLIVCAFFTAFTGASGVTIIALGGLLYPILKKEGYNEKFTLGIITTSGSLGLLFPPSLPIILYGIVAKVDIDKLFKAGILPGILLIIVLSVWSMMQKKEKVATSGEEAVVVPFKQAIWDARYELPLPILILGGIYGGYVTASEASALTAVYVFIMEVVLYKDVSITKDVPGIVKDSMTLVGAILLILCCALGLTNYLVDEEIPMKILEMMKQYIDSKYMFLLFLNIFLLIVGALMDIFSAIIVVVPIILPMAQEYGVDPIHLAIIFLTNLEIGFITPPVGINLFISSFRFDKSVLELYKASFPFLILLVFALLIITYIPSLSLVWFQ